MNRYSNSEMLVGNIIGSFILVSSWFLLWFFFLKKEKKSFPKMWYFITLFIILVTICLFSIDLKTLPWNIDYIQIPINWFLKPIFSFLTFVLINLAFIVFRNQIKVNGIENELKNSLSRKNEKFESELESKIKKNKSYYIYGNKGSSKTSSVIHILKNRNKRFFYYDCTYDKFMELIFVNDNYIYKLIFITVKWLIKRFYEIIIIDDIHLSSKENILEISEWLENYKNQIIIISPQNFRYVDIYNYGDDYETISSVIDKLYSRHNLKEITINSDTFKKSEEINHFMEENFHWKNENKRLEPSFYKIKSTNKFFDFYKKILLLVGNMMKETNKDIYDDINVILNSIVDDINQFICQKKDTDSGYEKLTEIDKSEYKNKYKQNPLVNEEYGYEVSLLIFLKFYKDSKMIEKNVIDIKDSEKIKENIQENLINEYDNFLNVLKKTKIDTTNDNSKIDNKKFFEKFKEYINDSNKDFFEEFKEYIDDSNIYKENLIN